MRFIRTFFTASIRRRMLSSFAIVIVLVVAMAVTGWVQLGRIEAFSELVVPNSTQMDHLQNLALSLSSLNTSVERYLIVGGLEFEERIFRDLDQIQINLDALEENATPGTEPLLVELDYVITNLEADITELVERPPTSSRTMNEKIIAIVVAIDSAQQLHRELSEITLNQLRAAVQEQKGIIANISTQFLIMSGVASLAVVLASLLVTRSIATPLTRLSQEAVRIAGGDFSVQVPVSTQDETGQLAEAFNHMTVRLRDLVDDLEQEIVERRRTENLLRSEKEFTDTVLDAQLDTFFLFELDTSKALRWNRAFRDISGYTDAEIADQPAPATYYSPADLERTKVFTQKVLAEGTGTIELELVSKEGQRIPTEYQVSVIRDSQGEAKYLISIGRNITRRKQADAELRQSSNRLLMALQASQMGTWDWDLRANQVNWSDETLGIFGVSRDEFGGTYEDYLSFVVPEMRDAVTQRVEAFLAVPDKNTLIQYEHPILGGHGQPKWVEVRGMFFDDEQGQLTKLIGICADITNRKRAEQNLQNYARQLETLNKISAALTTSLALEDVLKLILEHIHEVVPVDSAAIFLKVENGLRIVMDWGIAPSVVGYDAGVDTPLFAEISTRRTPLVLDNPLTDPRFKNWADAQEVQTWMGVPLLVRGETIGYLTLDSNQPQAYQSSQIPLMESFAAQAAQAIDNARQFSTSQRRLERLSSLHQIDQVISSSLDLSVTLNILLEQVLLQLKVDAAAVLLYQPELQSLEYVAGRGFRTQVLQYTALNLGEGFAGVAALEQRVVKVLEFDRIENEFSQSPEMQREQFVAYIGVPLIAKGSIIGVLEIYHRKPLYSDAEWMTFLNTLSGQAAIAIENINLFSDLQKSNLELIQAYDATIEGWARALELRDMETEGHSRRVVELTLELAAILNLPKDQLVHVRRGALLHDIGKVGVPDRILQKTDELTAAEWEIMRQHPVYAYNMLVSIPYLRQALDIPYCHHEKWDGSGYPRGLKEAHIPLAARVFAIVDVWDALLSDRPYRRAWPVDKVLAYIQEQSGKHFDPQVVTAFIALLSSSNHLDQPR